ncbi:helix-turn-helix domain-containing protein [Aureivirga marina]|uniref:hypothetical protein n=1 Tax=Aureivirga marina TaxID=1182451 RepID=UPI0018C9AECE|nr:hypothetical protein [Aureivirga marina]
MKNKLKEKEAPVQIAGVSPMDCNIEFVGTSVGRKVIWLQNGKSRHFEELPKSIIQELGKMYLNTPEAILEFTTNPEYRNPSLERQIELFTFYNYGDLDDKPDVINGKLQASENFREKENCPSLKFKEIKINGASLTKEELKIIDLFKKDFPDKACWDELGVKESQFKYLKSKLYRKANVQSKTGLLIRVFHENI